MMFYTGSDHSEGKNPTSSLPLLNMCCVATNFDILDRVQTITFYSLNNHLIDMINFQFYYKLHKHIMSPSGYRHLASFSPTFEASKLRQLPLCALKEVDVRASSPEFRMNESPPAQSKRFKKPVQDQSGITAHELATARYDF
jgi:hypothetical protein